MSSQHSLYHAQQMAAAREERLNKIRERLAGGASPQIETFNQCASELNLLQRKFGLDFRQPYEAPSLPLAPRAESDNIAAVERYIRELELTNKKYLELLTKTRTQSYQQQQERVLFTDLCKQISVAEIAMQQCLTLAKENAAQLDLVVPISSLPNKVPLVTSGDAKKYLGEVHASISILQQFLSSCSEQKNMNINATRLTGSIVGCVDIESLKKQRDSETERQRAEEKQTLISRYPDSAETINSIFALMYATPLQVLSKTTEARCVHEAEVLALNKLYEQKSAEVHATLIKEYGAALTQLQLATDQSVNVLSLEKSLEYILDNSAEVSLLDDAMLFRTEELLEKQFEIESITQSCIVSSHNELPNTVLVSQFACINGQLVISDTFEVLSTASAEDVSRLKEEGCALLSGVTGDAKFHEEDMEQEFATYQPKAREINLF
jgi:hypothetical protein